MSCSRAVAAVCHAIRWHNQNSKGRKLVGEDPQMWKFTVTVNPDGTTWNSKWAIPQPKTKSEALLLHTLFFAALYGGPLGNKLGDGLTLKFMP